MTETEPKRKNKKKQKHSKIISFDEEVIKREDAQKIISNDNELVNSKNQFKHLRITDITDNDNTIENSSKKKKRNKKNNSLELADICDTKQDTNDSQAVNSKRKKKKNKCRAESNPQETIGNVLLEDSSPNKKKKRKSGKNSIETDSLEEMQVEEPLHKKKKKEKLDEQPGEQTEGSKKKTVSHREIKRQKHAKLLEEKKQQTEHSLLQKAITYLSNWKHNKELWKFEKLRQIWLQQNMYDKDKIPEESWPTLLEYMNNSKGHSREVIVKEAMKIVETEVEQIDEVKALRAREICQYLKE